MQKLVLPSLVAGVGFFIALTSRIVENFACDYSPRFLLALSPSHRENRSPKGFRSLTHSLRPEGHGRANRNFETKKKKPTPNLWFNLGFFCVRAIKKIILPFCLRDLNLMLFHSIQLCQIVN